MNTVGRGGYFSTVIWKSKVRRGEREKEGMKGGGREREKGMEAKTQ